MKHSSTKIQRCSLTWVCLILAIGGFCLSAHAAPPDTFHIILRGGEIFDGTGGPSYRADIGIVDDTIAAIGDLSGAEAPRVIDLTGKAVTPGFIDLHSHADGGTTRAGLRSRNPRRRAAPNLVSQGITTVVVNQDGRSPLNLLRQRGQLVNRGFGPNAVLMVGHNTIRSEAMPARNRNRAATQAEMDTMVSLVREGMEAGAFGLTAGLEYEPGIWSTTSELVTLVNAIVPYGGVYIAHERSSGADPMWYLPSRHGPNPPTMLDSIHEIIFIAASTHATVVATHIKARGLRYWGQSDAIIDAIERARNRGLAVYADQYPYTSSGSDGIVSLIPHWVAGLFDAGADDVPPNFANVLAAAMASPDRAAAIRADIAHEISRRGGASRIIIFDYPEPKFIGKSLEAIAVEHELSPVNMAIQLQLEGYATRFGGARIRGFSLSREDVNHFAGRPWVATASDAGIALRVDDVVHPRFYGTFPRKLREFALRREILSVEAAIHSMTGLPAEILGIEDRGRIEKGARADITVIDLEHVRDKATFSYPHRYPEGIEYVFVNGVAVVDEGNRTWTLPGRVLRPQRSGPIKRDETG